MDSMEPEVAAIFRTVASCDRDKIDEAIENYKDPHGTYERHWLFQKKDGDGRNLLHYACMYNTDEVATWMLSLTAFDGTTYYRPIPKMSDKFGATAVMYAARSGMVTFVNEWIKMGNDIMSVDHQDRNILHYCCGAGEAIPELPGAKETPYNVQLNGIRLVVDVLVDNGINISAVDKMHQTPVQYYIENTFRKCLLLHASDAYKAKKIWRRLFETLDRFQTGCTHQNHEFEIKTQEIYGGLIHTSVALCFLQSCTTMNNAQTIKQFEERVISGKLYVNETDDNGMTALHHLCYFEYNCEHYGLREALVSKLLEMGADPYIRDIRGYTPLMCATEKGHVVTSDPRSDKGGMTMLLTAIGAKCTTRKLNK